MNAGKNTCLNKFKIQTGYDGKKITPIPTPYYVTNFLIMSFNIVHRSRDNPL
jgi:hypothetical protein